MIRQNHIGDWGTQFGMLIQYLDEHPDAQWRHSDLAAGEVESGASTVSALDGLYQVARAQFDADEAFADRARARVVALQAGDADTVALWREIVDESELAFREIYGRLGVLLEPGDSAGESFYNQWLAEVVDELLAAGVATHSDGAVRLRRRTSRARRPAGRLIVQKRDGGYGYATTDLATLRYRVRDLKADRILYVVDARQALHFRMVFEAARRMGWLADGVEAVHVAFGTVLGPDGKPFKTRAGGTRAADAPARRGRRRRAAHRRRARARPARGRAGPHRRAGRHRRGQVRRPVDLPRQGLRVRPRPDGLADRQHRRLPAVRARPDPVDPAQGGASAADRPSRPRSTRRCRCTRPSGRWCWRSTVRRRAAPTSPRRASRTGCATTSSSSAQAFTDFYENCPVLKAPDDVRANRLALCRLTAATLHEGLGLLGIAAPERM